MLRGALIGLMVGFVCLLCGGCAPPPSAPPSPAIPSAAPSLAISGTGTGTAGCTAQAFANAVQVLGTNYIPSTLNPPNVPTTFLSSSTQTWQDLVAAFNAAPPSFRQKLCLTTVYINPTSCAGTSYLCFGANSWGFRNPRDNTQRYIGLSQSLWSGGQAPALSVFEKNILAEVMQQQGMPWPPASGQVPPPPAFSHAVNGSTSVDTPAMAVLAALSHEYGHILWYDVLKVNPSNYSPNSFCRQTGIGFFDNAWITPINTPLPWLYFGETTTVDGRTDRHAGTLQIQDLKNAVNKPDFQKAAKLLN
ncbi:MAG: hypothetical protein JO081_00035, partial [Alphaproteobacteria bacterium]|nr:hypothetical protein [Alphaproteobacteria bacterium]